MKFLKDNCYFWSIFTLKIVFLAYIYLWELNQTMNTDFNTWMQFMMKIS